MFREYARLTAYENEGRFLDLRALIDLGPEGYDQLEPVQWPATGGADSARLFADGRFAHADGRARMVPVRQRPPAAPLSAGFPLSLNTGRVRDHWHTMTRTGLAPALCRHAPEPYVEVHPDDAAAVGVVEGGLTRVETERGVAVVVARVTERQRRGGVFMPMHFTDAFAPSGRSNPLIGPHVDPESGQPEFKHTPARVRPYRETWRGFFMSRSAAAAPKGLELIWRRQPRQACQLHEFAGRGEAEERDAVRRLFTESAAGEVVRFEDPGAGTVREARIVDGRLEQVLFMTLGGRLPPRDWLADLFAQDVLSGEARSALLIGQAPGAAPSPGAVVCACLGVGEAAIRAAIAAGARNLDAVGKATGAGTSCGSCRPEISRLVAAHPRQEDRHAA